MPNHSTESDSQTEYDELTDSIDENASKLSDSDYEPLPELEPSPANISTEVYFLVYDNFVKADGTFDAEYVHAQTYEPYEGQVMVGKVLVSFTPLRKSEVIQSKLHGLETALELYRAESRRKIEQLQGKIDEFKALEAPK